MHSFFQLLQMFLCWSVRTNNTAKGNTSYFIHKCWGSNRWGTRRVSECEHLSVLVLHSLWFAQFLILLLRRLLTPTRAGHSSASAAKQTSAGASSSFALLFILLGPPSATPFRHHLLFDHVDDLIRDSEILDCASSDVTLRHPPELISIPWCADNFSQVDVHPVVTANQMAVVRLSILQLHQHRMVLSCLQQR